ETLLSKVAEPLETFAHTLGKPYNHDKLEYAWKKLMQNHPHDSICGCSVDEVHRGMVNRFSDSRHVTETITHEALQSITCHVDTKEFGNIDKHAMPFVAYNTSGYNRSSTLSVVWDVISEYYRDGVNKNALTSFYIVEKQLVDVNVDTYVFDL